MNISIICGSPRKGSNSMKVAKAISQQVQPLGHEVNIVSFEEYDIPFIAHGSVDKDQLTPFQTKLRDSMTNARLVFLVAPEYNWSTSAELINFVHQMGKQDFTSMFDNKLFAFAGVSNGRGGRLPCILMQTVLGKILNIFNLDSMISSKMLDVQFTQQVLDENGNSLGNPDFERGFKNFLDYSLKLANRWEE